MDYKGIWILEIFQRKNRKEKGYWSNLPVNNYKKKKKQDNYFLLKLILPLQNFTELQPATSNNIYKQHAAELELVIFNFYTWASIS